MSLPLLGIRFSFFLQQGGFLASMKDRPLFTDILNSQTILQRGVLCGNNYYFILLKTKFLVKKEKQMSLT